MDLAAELVNDLGGPRLHQRFAASRSSELVDVVDAVRPQRRDAVDAVGHRRPPPTRPPRRGAHDDHDARSSSTRSRTSTSTTRPRCTGGCATRRRSTTARSTGSTRCRASPTSCPPTATWQAFSSAHGIELFTLLDEDPEEVASYRSIIMMDPPEHDVMRALVSRVFTPRAIAALEPMIREVIAGFLDDARRRRRASTRSPTSRRLFPVEVISRMLGVPDGERQQIRHWIDVSLRREPGQTRAQRRRTTSRSCEMGAYFYELVTEKRKQPGRRHAVAAHPGHGRPRRRYRDRARRRRDRRLRHAARWRRRRDRDQARRQRGGAVLARTPTSGRRSLDDREQDPRRGRGDPARTCRRRSTRAGTRSQDREFDGGTIPAGFPVLLLTGAATRDPRAFERRRRLRHRPPAERRHRLRPRRAQLPRRGAGPAWRAASRSTSSRTRWPTFEVDEAGLRRVQMSNVAGYSNVPVHTGR